MEATDPDLFSSGELAASALDRQIDLSAISWYALGWAAVLLLAAAIRFAGLRAWPLAAGEAGIASDAYQLLHGGAISAAGAAHPLATALASLSFFLFAAGDGAARLVPLLAGLATIALCWPLRDTLSRPAVLGAALVAALSPALTFAGQRLDGAALLTLSSLLLLLALRRAGRRPGFGNALLAGVAAALLPLSDPLGWLALPLVAGFALVLLPRDERPAATMLPGVVLGAASAVLLVTSSLLIHPAGLSDFFSASLGQLWHQQLGNLGQLWQLPVFELVIDDLPALVFAIVGLAVFRRKSHAARVLAWWSAAALVLASLLGAKDTASYALVALPLALLAGYGLAWLIARVRWPVFGTYSGLGFAVALIATIAAAASALGVILGMPSGGSLHEVVKFVLLVVLILAPLLLVTIRLGRALNGTSWPLLALVGVALLLGLGLRTSTLLASTTESRGGDILTANSTSPDVGSLVERLRTISRDMTDFKQSALDPAGGHGLTIAADDALAEPFRWYFRDFPSFQVAPDASAVTPAPQVVISSAPPLEHTSRAARSFAYRTTLAASLARPNWGHLVFAVADPNQIRGFLGFLIDHKVANPPPAQQFTLSLSPDVGARLFGVTP
ncbi:MAG TPA: glycosyltransferase family 39 protein [Nitrolancea sp.]|nr:glycosyltransferase family 39 protein [Nitrolancea sp.]